MGAGPCGAVGAAGAGGAESGGARGAAGRAEGGAERRGCEGRAADILLVLRTRGITVPEEIEQRIAACTDPAVLSRWLERAVTAQCAAEVMELSCSVA